MMPADFARVPPGLAGSSVAGGHLALLALPGRCSGRTDAGRPELPRTQEVGGRVASTVLPADFARVPPGLSMPLGLWDNLPLVTHDGPVVGRTDAGRPELPRTQEVGGRVVSTVLPADFARVPPGLAGSSVAGGHLALLALPGRCSGRTDAGRPELPRTQEVVE